MKKMQARHANIITMYGSKAAGSKKNIDEKNLWNAQMVQIRTFLYPLLWDSTRTADVSANRIKRSSLQLKFKNNTVLLSIFRLM